jgi:hypothetical protein
MIFDFRNIRVPGKKPEVCYNKLQAMLKFIIELSKFNFP